jgi:hypothetical protein
MSLWDVLSKVRGTTKEHLIEHRFDAAHTDRGGAAVKVESDRHYFRVTLAQMFLRQQSQFLTTYYPAAYSVVSVLFGGATVDISNVADESRLTAKQDKTGDVVAKNFVLSPLVPFKGDVVKFAASLHAVEGTNKLRGYLKTMGEFAKLLVVPQLSAVINVATPLAAGLQAIFAETGSGAHLVYANSFVGASDTSSGAEYLQSGYVAVIRAPQGKVDVASLYVVGNELREGKSVTDNTPFTKHDYMLLHVEVREERDDFNQLSAIRKAMDQAVEAAAADDQPKADAFFRVAIAAVMQAPEFTKADRRRVVELLKHDFAEVKAGFAPSNLTAADGVDLQGRWNQQTMTINDALAMGEPTFGEMFGAPSV